MACSLPEGALGPFGLAFGPDNNLYVAGNNNSAVLRYNGVTGVPMGILASGGGLSGVIGITFGPDRDLYADSIGTNQALRYNGTTGAFMGVFASAGGLVLLLGGGIASRLRMPFLTEVFEESCAGLRAGIGRAINMSYPVSRATGDSTGRWFAKENPDG